MKPTKPLSGLSRKREATTTANIPSVPVPVFKKPMSNPPPKRKK
jgi:hypothetical protein